MNTNLLTMEQVVRFISLKGGNLLESMDLADRLRVRTRGLTGEDMSASVLKADYTEGFRTARGDTCHPGPSQVPTDGLIAETRQALTDVRGPQLREHFMAMGVLNGIADANPRLVEYAKLVILYSLELSYSDVLELIATGPLPL